MEIISKNHLKEISKLQQKKFRIQEKKVVVEGTRLLSQLQAYNYDFLELYTISEDQDFTKINAIIYKLDKSQMQKICGTKHPQSVAALVKIPASELKETDFLLYLDRITDPGNMGTIFRTAAAARVDGIVLSPDCCDPFNSKSIRASLGAVFGLPFSIKNEAWLLSQHNKLIATALDNSEDIYQVDLPGKNVILILGSEAFGVSESILKASDKIVEIPHYGEIESMNVGVAAGIAIYEICKKRYR